MNFRKTIPVALCALITAAMPAFSAGTADTSEPSSKDLFRTQLNNQKEEKNTGVQYWIELKRGAQHLKVSNKYPFKTGDQVRFHVVPNIDGYAYVLLKSGSRGERAVLFPNERAHENNHVAHGRDVMIPGDGTYLQFDENPGTEQLSLVISRAPINATAYLESTGAPVMIASAEGGSKDLIPTKVYVSYGVPHGRPIGEKNELSIAANVPDRKPFQPVANPTEVNAGAKKAHLKKVAVKKHAAEKVERTGDNDKVEIKRVRISSQPARSAQRIASIPPRAGVIQGHVQVDTDGDPSVTTVVFQGTGALQVDVALDHN
ncbi:MAG: DUF4384 domain-containing protein [Candidatus Melainabacteria bacterium]|nr:DUF4384 domain-containing protein [Candidatus Melainabacteria bacterium]